MPWSPAVALPGTVFFSAGVPSPAASASPGSQTEVRILQTHPDLLSQKLSNVPPERFQDLLKVEPRW